MTAVLLLAAGCAGPADTGESAVPIEGPVLEHQPPDGALIEGEDLLLQVGATDPQGVADVAAHFRVQGAVYWQELALAPGSDGTWTGTVPGSEVFSPALEYWFSAEDAGSPAGVSRLPEAGEHDPFSLPVSVEGSALPFMADFEPAEGQRYLYDLGWADFSQGFAGYPWELSQLQALSGATSVYHARGYEGVDDMDDWLVSPPLDLSSVARAQVTWWELGASTSSADHGLWISTGSRDPADGDYQQVAAIDAPGSSWGRSAVADLGPWAGAPVAWLAWRYRGSFDDDWFIDDIEVRELGCDVQPSLSWSPDPVHPGESVELDFSLENPMDEGCSGLSATLSLPDGAGTLDTPTVGGIELPSGGSTTVSFAVQLDSLWPDNSPMTVDLEVTDGTRTWRSQHRMIVGLPSEARVSMALDGQGLVQVRLGVGDPDAPAWEELVHADTEPAGELSLDVDLTDQWAMLPPSAGERRWFARVDSEAAGRFESFEIDYGGQSFAATVLPELEAGAQVHAWIPEPPDPVVVSVQTSPDPVGPGDQAAIVVDLRNDGADTSGVTTVELVSTDPDLSVLSGGPREIGSGSWGAGSQARIAPPFQVAVDAAHVDSRPVGAELVVDDGVEQWSLPVEIEVPWPVFKVVGVSIDDTDGGDGDGLLEPGESAELGIELTNAGGLDASGFVDARLEIAPSSTASASTSGATDTLGSMAVHRTRTGHFAIDVDQSSSLGDTLDLELHLEDDTATYQASTQLVLGELPWLSLSPVDDPIGDAYGYEVDLVNGAWRTDGSTFEFVFETADPVDVSTAFVEAWIVNVGGGDYAYYRLVLNGGAATLQGYDSTFLPLATPSVQLLDDTRVELAWDVADMAIADPYLLVGLGAGWCGTDTGSYCDHFPDGWGYYYTGYTSSDFFAISW